MSAARVGRIVRVPIVGGVRGIVRVIGGVRGIPGVPPREAERNEIKTEKETVLMMKEELNDGDQRNDRRDEIQTYQTWVP